ncbi:MAG: hypothetical protein NZ772_12660 [Cyanobacteria bacterium]|nr:hypothetical protein [Cyanobacteriota bacterium]
MHQLQRGLVLWLSLALVTVTTIVTGVAIAPTTAQMQLTEQSRVNINSFGPIQVGMTVAAAEKAAQMSLLVQSGQPRNTACYYVVPSRTVRGVGFMVINSRDEQPDKQQDRIARIDVWSNSLVMTTSGARIGDFESRLRTLYPEARVTPHDDIPGGRYFTIVPQAESDSNYRLIFETDGRRIVRFRAGQLPEVNYPKGCT